MIDTHTLITAQKAQSLIRGAIADANDDDELRYELMVAYNHLDIAVTRFARKLQNSATSALRAEAEHALQEAE
jgi:hypothetical protein